MIWIVRCSLRTYLSYPLTSSTLHVVPELVENENDFIYLRTACKRGRFICSYWVDIDVSLKGEKAFSINLPFPSFKVMNTPDLSVSSCLNSLYGEKDFLWCLNLPRVYISSPLDALRTFNLASICLCKEVFQSVLACTRSKAKRTSPLSRLHSLKGALMGSSKLLTIVVDH